MTFSQLGNAVKDHWKVVLLFTVAGLMLGIVAALVMPKVYESQVQVFVHVQTPSTVAELQMGEEFAKARAASYAQTADTSVVLGPVVDQLQLDIPPERLATSVTATHQPNTAMITITAEARDPQQAANIVAQTAESLIRVAATLEEAESPEASPVQLDVVQRAAVPAGPVAPSLPLNMAAGLVVGSLLGIVVAVRRASAADRAQISGGLFDEPSNSSNGAPRARALGEETPVVPVDEDSRR